VGNTDPTLFPQRNGLETLGIRDYIAIARRRRVPIFLCSSGFFIFGIVFAICQPSFYRSETLIMVDPQQVPSSYVQSTVSSSVQDRLSTIQEQVMSATHLQHIIDTLGLYPELRGKRSQQEVIGIMRIATNVEFVSPGEHRLSAFRIGFQSKDAQTAARVANELAKEFIDENLRARLAQFNGAADFLQSELRDTKAQLEVKEQELQRIKVQNVTDLPESRQYHMEAINNLRGQLRAAQDRLSNAREQKMLLQQYAPTVDLDSGNDGAGVSPQQSQIQKAEAQLSQLRARYGPGHPDVRKMENQLAGLRAEESAEKKQQESMGSPKVTSVMPSRANNPVLQAEEGRLSQEIKQQTALEKDIQEQLKAHTDKLEHGPVFEQRIASLMRDYENLRAHYSSLLDKKLSAEMAKELEGRQQGERFVILDAAQVPQKPAGPNRGLIITGGLILGILAGIALVLVMEFSDESVRSERDAATILGKSVLVCVPRVLQKWERRRSHLRLIAAFAGTAASAVILAYAVVRISAGLL
jgi:polysaccharide chain length determinant protein (PEP-CTERM system associated)